MLLSEVIMGRTIKLYEDHPELTEVRLLVFVLSTTMISCVISLRQDTTQS